ncbi:hypothetical protein O181_110382 [Austropuccinia psidii MF-1]|uniref:Uncharacterized protein n=1 Tax=Austropuccinia psidii MF-1 TaxID=1389203 RepID=A0A9Q3PSB0_9BASI|nr:hypothetical protein [Austropuccinia psidii MF-1]
MSFKNSSGSYHYYYPREGSTPPEQEFKRAYSKLIPTPRTEAEEKERVRRFYLNIIKQGKKLKKESIESGGSIYKVESMDQSTSKLPPLPEDTVEGHYEEESEEGDQSEYLMRLFKGTQEKMAQKLQDTINNLTKKKGKRTEATSYTPGASPSEPSLPRNVRPEESPRSPTPVPRAISTPATESRPSNTPRRVFLSTPAKPSPLQQEIPRKEKSVVKTKAKNYNLNFNGEEVEKFIKKI